MNEVKEHLTEPKKSEISKSFNFELDKENKS